jgi:NAD(P)H-hydrate epimerase
VTIACTSELRSVIATALPEATYLTLAGDHGDAGRISAVLESYQAVLVGPGIGRSDHARRLLTALQAAPAHTTTCVLDADALNELAPSQDASPWRTDGLFKNWPSERAILTPHPGEMARLLGTTVDAVQSDRLKVAMDAASAWQQIVVLKGAHTITAAPDGRAMINPHANPLLAVAGTGDVLAGVIAGLAAQGMEPFEAAACGVYVHGLAGEELATQIGDRGLLASELAAAIPAAIREVREGKRMVARGRGGIDGLASLAGFGQFGGFDAPTDA